MPRNAYGPLACVLLSLAPLACGARTTLTDDESFGGQAGTFGAGGSPGGSGGIAGDAGATGSGGVAGDAGAAGSGGVAGSGIAGSSPGGTTGTAGAGGEPAPGRLRKACRELCRPYTEVCPLEFPNVEGCVRECMDGMNSTPAECRSATAAALECLGAWLLPNGSCEDSLTKAAANCEYELWLIEQCGDAPAPPPPDDCSGTSTSTLETCSVNLYCENGNYWVACEQVSPDFSSCECTSQWAITSLSVAAPGGEACSEALVRCGYGF